MTIEAGSDAEQLKLVDQYYSDIKTFLRYRLGLGDIAMHYGFCESPEDDPVDAMTRMTLEVCNRIDVTETDRVLDDGCGIGGSAKVIAEDIGAQVVGVTISERQVKVAQFLSWRHGYNELASFQPGNFNDLDFPDASFTKAIAIESLCHAVDKSVPLAEVFRVLSSGGKFGGTDGFLVTSSIAAEDEEEIYGPWKQKWAVPGLETEASFKQILEEVGFVDVQFEDITDNIMPFAEWLYERAEEFQPLRQVLRVPRRLMNALPLLPKEERPIEVFGGQLQLLMFERDIAKYGMWTATKP